MNRRKMLSAAMGAACGSARAASSFPETMQRAIEIIQRQVSAGTINAAAFQSGRGSDDLARAFGSAGSPDAMFLLGSITKPLTAIAVMVLADRGDLRLSDSASKYLPELREGDRARITIEHLLIHTSGLPDQLPENNALRARHAPLAEFVAGAARVPLLFPPGTRYHYQSMGILLAAEILERVSGRKLPDFLEAAVFKPLGMTRTVLGLGRFAKSDVVPMQTEHAAPEAGAGDPNAKNWDWNSSYWRALGAPWGGAHSTIGDLTKLLRYFMKPDDRVLRPDTARWMIRDHTPGLEARRGIGWMLGSALGKGCSSRAFGHSGSTGTLAWADPATDTTFALLTSLPKNVSGDLVLRPVSDLVSSGR